jgi:hypothetical protein
MQKWLMSNLTGLVAAAALTLTLATGLMVTIAQVRCTLLDEDVARLKGRLREEVDSLKDEQDTNHKAVLGVVNETVKRVAAHLEAARETPEKPDEPAKPEEEPATNERVGGFE